VGEMVLIPLDIPVRSEWGSWPIRSDGESCLILKILIVLDLDFGYTFRHL
jgi:hypothetical protein